MRGGPPVRVAWLGKRVGGDGLTMYSREITRGLRERGVDVTFVHHDAASAGEGSIELPSIPISQRWGIAQPRARRTLVEGLRRNPVDLVHVSLAFSSLDFALPAVCRALGVPLVATLHAPFDTRLTMWGGLSHVLYRIYAVPLARFDRVIVFGPAQRRLLAQMGVGDDVIRVVPNGVDVSRFRPGRSDMAAKLGADRLFVYVGRLGAEKNVDLLLTTFLEANPPPGLKLALVGDGKEREGLQRRFRDPRILFLGQVADETRRIALLRAASAFFLPSAIEGLSLALLEAMACGVCPVATDVGCDRDVVRGAGITLDARSLESDLRLAMRLLIATPELARTLGRLARGRVLARYSLTANIDALLDLYRELLRGLPSGHMTASPIRLGG
jgi:glycosyltransferase involved in cell wall biosynthesis